MGTCNGDEDTLGLFGNPQGDQNHAARPRNTNAQMLHGAVKQMTSVTSETGRIGEEPHYAFLEVLNTAQNEHGIIGHTRWH